jgi:hypothetical protein
MEMVWLDLLELADSEKVFAGLFIISLFMVARWVKKFIDEQTRENNERERYILEYHKEQITDMKMDKANIEQRFQNLIEQQKIAFDSRVSILVSEHKEMLREQRQENANREKELMEFLNKTGERMDDIGQTLHKVQTSLEKIEEKMDEGFQEVWKEIKKEEEK